MQVLVHILIFQGILCSFLCRIHRGIQVLQLQTKSHANLKWVCHICVLKGPSTRLWSEIKEWRHAATLAETGQDVDESMARASKRQVDPGESDGLLGEDAPVKLARGKAPAQYVQPAPECSC